MFSRRMDNPPMTAIDHGFKGVLRHAEKHGKIQSRAGRPSAANTRFRGVIFDIDPQFANTDEWYEAIRKRRGRSRISRSTTCSPRMTKATTWPMFPSRTSFPTRPGEPVDHPDLSDLFGEVQDGRYPLEFQLN